MNDKCPICLDELRSNMGVISSCGHCLHDACWQELKQNHTNSEHENIGGNSTSNKHPRCPICKHKAKRFVKMYLQLSSYPRSSTIKNINSKDSTNASSSSCLVNIPQDGIEQESNGHHNDHDSNCLEDHYMAIHSLSTENFQLKKKIRSLESVSKDQSELLLEVLPKYDALEDQVKLYRIEKAYLESKLDGMEAENAELISEWNMVEIKLQQLQGENDGLRHELKQSQMENGLLRSSRDILAERLAKSMRKKRKQYDFTIQEHHDQKENCQNEHRDNHHHHPQHKSDKSLGTARSISNVPNRRVLIPRNDTVVSRRRRHRTRERIAQDYELEKIQLKSMLAEANVKTNKLEKRVAKMKRRIHDTKRIRSISV